MWECLTCSQLPKTDPCTPQNAKSTSDYSPSRQKLASSVNPLPPCSVSSHLDPLTAYSEEPPLVDGVPRKAVGLDLSMVSIPERTSEGGSEGDDTNASYLRDFRTRRHAVKEGNVTMAASSSIQQSDQVETQQSYYTAAHTIHGGSELLSQSPSLSSVHPPLPLARGDSLPQLSPIKQSEEEPSIVSSEIYSNPSEHGMKTDHRSVDTSISVAGTTISTASASEHDTVLDNLRRRRLELKREREQSSGKKKDISPSTTESKTVTEAHPSQVSSQQSTGTTSQYPGEATFSKGTSDLRPLKSSVRNSKVSEQDSLYDFSCHLPRAVTPAVKPLPAHTLTDRQPLCVRVDGNQHSTSYHQHYDNQSLLSANAPPEAGSHKPMVSSTTSGSQSQYYHNEPEYLGQAGPGPIPAPEPMTQSGAGSAPSARMTGLYQYSYKLEKFREHLHKQGKTGTEIDADPDYLLMMEEERKKQRVHPQPSESSPNYTSVPLDEHRSAHERKQHKTPARKADPGQVPKQTAVQPTQLKLGGTSTSFSTDPCRVFVGSGLPAYVNEQHIREHFHEFSHAITRVDTIRNKKSKKPKGYFFVTFQSQVYADMAVQRLNHSFLLGEHRLKVEKQKTAQPQLPISPQSPVVISSEAKDSVIKDPGMVSRTGVPTLVVDNLDPAISNDEVKALIGVPVIKTTMLEPGSHKRYLQFHNLHDASTAMHSLNGKHFLGKVIQAVIMEDAHLPYQLSNFQQSALPSAHSPPQLPLPTHQAYYGHSPQAAAIPKPLLVDARHYHSKVQSSRLGVLPQSQPQHPVSEFQSPTNPRYHRQPHPVTFGSYKQSPMPMFHSGNSAEPDPHAAEEVKLLKLQPEQWNQLMTVQSTGTSLYQQIISPFQTNPKVRIEIQADVRVLKISGVPAAVSSACEHVLHHMNKDLHVTDR